MHEVTTYLRLLAVAAVTLGIRRAVPIPLPLLQILAGAVLAWPLGVTVDLEPEVFLLVFIPPLLFLDGWRIPKRTFQRMRNVILLMAFGLVVFSVIGAGLLIHAVIPAMPLFIAFALAAALSPTDAVAVAGITGRTKVPTLLMNVLGGEALLNDASGLVCMRVAVAAAATGIFSWMAAARSLLLVSIGGVAIGILITVLYAKALLLLFRRHPDAADARLLILLTLPYAAYLLGEHSHVSGILAAATAGMTSTRVEFFDVSEHEARRQTGAVLRAIEHAFNGLVFVLLGLELPRIAKFAPNVISWSLLARAVLSVWFALFALRWLWVWVTMRITLYRYRRPGRPSDPVSLRLVTATAFAGVRGAVSLAAALLLPAFVNTADAAYPARPVAVAIAAGVIVLSLASASIALPIVLRGLRLPEPDTAHEQRSELRSELAEAAIVALEKARDERGGRAAAAVAVVLDTYRVRAAGEVSGDRKEYELLERELRLLALHAERDLLHAKWRRRAIDESVYRDFMQEIDANEAALSHQGLLAAAH